MAITPTKPLKNDPIEGFEEDFDPNTDAADVRGIYIQDDSGTDTDVLLSRDASSGNMTFQDQHNGVTTLSTITLGGYDLTKHILGVDGSFVYVGDGDYVKKV